MLLRRSGIAVSWEIDEDDPPSIRKKFTAWVRPGVEELKASAFDR